MAKIQFFLVSNAYLTIRIQTESIQNAYRMHIERIPTPAWIFLIPESVTNIPCRTKNSANFFESVTNRTKLFRMQTEHQESVPEWKPNANRMAFGLHAGSDLAIKTSVLETHPSVPSAAQMWMFQGWKEKYHILSLCLKLKGSHSIKIVLVLSAMECFQKIEEILNP